MSNLLVVLGDSPEVMVRKGEVKEGYYNPLGLFKEIHFIVCKWRTAYFKSQSPVEKEFSKTAGKAKAVFHYVGEIGGRGAVGLAEDAAFESMADLVEVRNPHWHGALGKHLAKLLGVPFVVYLHANFDDIRNFSSNNFQLKTWAKLKAYDLLYEKEVIGKANLVIAAYPTIVPFAKRQGAKEVEVIYNKVFLKGKSKVRPHQFVYPDGVKRPTILCVSRFILEKDPRVLIQALPGLPNVGLCLIGDGQLRDSAITLANNLKVRNRIIFIKSVPNKALGAYYDAATILAQPLFIKGIPIPVLEAFEAGLPVVTSSNAKEDVINRGALAVDGWEYVECVKYVLGAVINSKGARVELMQNGANEIFKIRGSEMERKEAFLLSELMVDG